MKILHLIQKPQLRGAEVFASQLATHINQAGHEAIIVPLFPGSASLPFEGKIISLNGKPQSRLWDIKAWKKLARIIQEEQPDVIQANAGDTMKYAVFSKLLFGWKQPIVFRNASTISLYIKTARAKKWYGFLFRYASKILSVSQTSAKDFAALFPQYKDRIVPVPIGIEPLEREATGKMEDEKYRLFGQKGPVLVHVGGFSFEKNHTGLISIFEQVLQQKPDATLHLLGDGPLKPQVENLVKQKGLQAQVKLYGFLKNPLEYIQSADVLLLPSIIEGLPGVILEAFYCQTPVVAYNVGGIKEVVINGETGRLVEKGDETTFSEQIIAALEKNEYNNRLVQNAYGLVTSQYMNSEITKKFLSVYASLINRQQPIPINQY